MYEDLAANATGAPVNVDAASRTPGIASPPVGVVPSASPPPDTPDTEGVLPSASPPPDTDGVVPSGSTPPEAANTETLTSEDANTGASIVDEEDTHMNLHN